MAEYDPTQFLWKGNPVSELTREEAQQAICHLAELVHSRAQSRQSQYKHVGFGYAFTPDEDGNLVGNFYTKE